DRWQERGKSDYRISPSPRSGASDAGAGKVPERPVVLRRNRHTTWLNSFQSALRGLTAPSGSWLFDSYRDGDCREALHVIEFGSSGCAIFGAVHRTGSDSMPIEVRLAILSYRALFFRSVF